VSQDDLEPYQSQTDELGQGPYPKDSLISRANQGISKLRAVVLRPFQPSGKSVRWKRSSRSAISVQFRCYDTDDVVKKYLLEKRVIIEDKS
jgi:hypothetical protein